MEDLGEKIEELHADETSHEDTADKLDVQRIQQGIAEGDCLTVLMSKLHEMSELSGKNPAKEYMKYIMGYAELIGKFTINKKCEINLMKVMLEYIMEDPDLEKAFMPTVQGLYDHEMNIISEEAVVEWLANAKKMEDEDFTPYINYMQPFVDWLEEASEDEDEE